MMWIKFNQIVKAEIANFPQALQLHNMPKFDTPKYCNTASAICKLNGQLTCKGTKYVKNFTQAMKHLLKPGKKQALEILAYAISHVLSTQEFKT